MASIPRSSVAETWLVGLAQDVIDHESCRGCKYNAAQALAALGLLDEVLERIGKPDPRTALGVERRSVDSAAITSTLTIVGKDGTVLRDAEADEWIHRHAEPDAATAGADPAAGEDPDDS